MKHNKFLREINNKWNDSQPVNSGSHPSDEPEDGGGSDQFKFVPVPHSKKSNPTRSSKPTPPGHFKLLRVNTPTSDVYLQAAYDPTASPSEMTQWSVCRSSPACRGSSSAIWIIPCTGRAAILDNCPGLLNLPIFDGLLISCGLAAGPVVFTPLTIVGISPQILLTNWPRRYLCHYPGLLNRPLFLLLVLVALDPVVPSPVACSLKKLIGPPSIRHLIIQALPSASATQASSLAQSSLDLCIVSPVLKNPILYPRYSLLRFTHIRAKSVSGINSPRFNPPEFGRLRARQPPAGILRLHLPATHYCSKFIGRFRENYPPLSFSSGLDLPALTCFIADQPILDLLFRFTKSWPQSVSLPKKACQLKKLVISPWNYSAYPSRPPSIDHQRNSTPRFDSLASLPPQFHHRYSLLHHPFTSIPTTPPSIPPLLRSLLAPTCFESIALLDLSFNSVSQSCSPICPPD
ncbi:hypothetical protein PGTUg99_024108 [Puccinia graminis f. sp. tritici]|uniref:Uncharacterized protein n=1 Tax=Puccinia graminis f. sp. tritici TaxID=56615 RepID=A0A5B0RRR1_PUCGR|nr:hypothetical protein PGTUg99_024108 [Puccinia graminis f. sp. tritici]